MAQSQEVLHPAEYVAAIDFVSALADDVALDTLRVYVNANNTKYRAWLIENNRMRVKKLYNLDDSLHQVWHIFHSSAVHLLDDFEALIRLNTVREYKLLRDTPPPNVIGHLPEIDKAAIAAEEQALRRRNITPPRRTSPQDNAAAASKQFEKLLSRVRSRMQIIYTSINPRGKDTHILINQFPWLKAQFERARKHLSDIISECTSFIRHALNIPPRAGSKRQLKTPQKRRISSNTPQTTRRTSPRKSPSSPSIR
jgi:hypothetical protein